MDLSLCGGPCERSGPHADLPEGLVDCRDSAEEKSAVRAPGPELSGLMLSWSSVGTEDPAGPAGLWFRDLELVPLDPNWEPNRY